MSVLDREAVLRYIEASLCPWCEGGPFRVLAQHTVQAHGIDRMKLRGLAGLNRSTSICSPEAHSKAVEHNLKTNTVRMVRGARLAKGIKQRPDSLEAQTNRKWAWSTDRKRGLAARNRTIKMRAKLSALRRKLTPMQEAEVRALYGQGLSQSSIAARYGMSQTGISAVIRRGK